MCTSLIVPTHLLLIYFKLPRKFVVCLCMSFMFWNEMLSQALWNKTSSLLVYPCHAVVVAMYVSNGHQDFFIGHTDKVLFVVICNLLTNTYIFYFRWKANLCCCRSHVLVWTARRRCWRLDKVDHRVWCVCGKLAAKSALLCSRLTPTHCRVSGSNCFQSVIRALCTYPLPLFGSHSRLLVRHFKLCMVSF